VLLTLNKTENIKCAYIYTAFNSYISGLSHLGSCLLQGEALIPRPDALTDTQLNQWCKRADQRT